MDRLENTLDFGSLMSAAVAARRLELIGLDTGTNPATRIDREEIAPGCRVKSNDDVQMGGTLVNGAWVGGEVIRVVCPADYPGWFTSLRLDQNGFVWGTDDSSQVNDRAPADPEEEPLPIFEEPAP